MKSKFYQDYSNEEIDDEECEDIRNAQILAASMFVNLCPISQLESMFDKKLFEV
jgi:hypothetical protein